VLHCPQAAVNLVSIQRFFLDNACYFILTATNYYIIDLQTQTLLLEGESENDMYPLRFGKTLHKDSKSFTALLGIKTTSLIWHFRLGHPSPEIVSRVVKDNNLPLSSSSSEINKVVCSACQLGKGKKTTIPCFYPCLYISFTTYPYRNLDFSYPISHWL
jgi:hypothetical protein